MAKYQALQFRNLDIWGISSEYERIYERPWIPNKNYISLHSFSYSEIRIPTARWDYFLELSIVLGINALIFKVKKKYELYIIKFMKWINFLELCEDKINPQMFVKRLVFQLTLTVCCSK